jgi:hypothetical protein
LHLARGERSMLDAFQSAAKTAALKDVGILAPLYDFYPSIESFLDTVVKKTIDQASDNPSLQPFDIKLLQALFLIRYVDEMKGNVDNLVTLCLDRIDADRIALKRQVEEGLGRLEKETLISRNGDVYAFLTNEERDINKEIKDVDIANGDEAKTLGEIVFDDVLKGQRKHRFSVNKMDFDFNRKCDAYLIGQNKERALLVSVISPLSDDYDLYDSFPRPRPAMNSSDVTRGRILFSRSWSASVMATPPGSAGRTSHRDPSEATEPVRQHGRAAACRGGNDAKIA